MSGLSSLSLNPRYVFGYKSDVKNSVQHIDEHKVVYPAGHNLVIFNMEDSSQHFFQGTEKSYGITAIAVSPLKKLLAVAERAAPEKGSKAVIIVYDTIAQRKKREVFDTDLNIQEYVDLAFPPSQNLERSFLLSLACEPTWTVIYWQWDRKKMIAYTQISVGPPITQMSWNPREPNCICFTGNGIFKYVRLMETTFEGIHSQMNGKDAEISTNFTCHTWLKDGNLAVCTDEGDVLILGTNGEYKLRLPGSPGTGFKITTIEASESEFYIGGVGGSIYVYEQDIDQPANLYKPATSPIKISLASLNPASNSNRTQVDATIMSMSISPGSGGTLVCGLDNNAIVQVPASNLTEEGARDFDYLVSSFHSNQITGLDVCIRKPLVVTCGKDKTVRIWNYQEKEKKQELSVSFAEEAFCVAFHPSGFHIIVGFSDKLRLMNVFSNNLKTYKDIQVKNCREARFSNGGQFFAAVNSNNIQVFNTYTCENNPNWIFKGHGGKVRALTWKDDDTGFISCGFDGAVYEWRLKDGQREQDLDFVQKSTSFSSVLVHPEGNIFAVGGDRTLYEIVRNTGTNTQDKKKHEVGIDISQIAFARTKNTFFIGTSTEGRPGSIRCYKYPMTMDYQSYQAHAGPIERIRVSHDEQYLFSVGYDGSLVIFDIKDKDSRKAGVSLLPHSEEVLVTKPDLDENIGAIEHLKSQIKETENNTSFKFEISIKNKDDQIKELNEQLKSESQQEKNRFEALLESKRELESEYDEKIANLREEHHAKLQELETSLLQDVMTEVSKYQNLQRDKEAEAKDHFEKLEQQIEENDREMNRIEEEFRIQHQEELTQLNTCKENKEDLVKRHEETIRQLIQDAETEKKEIDEKNYNELRKTEEENSKTKGDVSLIQKKQNSLEQQKTEYKDLIKQHKQTIEQQKDTLEKLKKDIENYTNQIQDRDKTIGEKEKRIYELKKNTQELEKFKFVLDFKIKELKREIGPREAMIKEMKKETNKMDGELKEFNKQNEHLGLILNDLRLRHLSMQEEIMNYRNRIRENGNLVKRFKDDIYETAEYIQDYGKLKRMVLEMYSKYVTSETKPNEIDSNIQNEYANQRSYLEKSVQTLKKKLQRDSEIHRKDNLRMMNENKALIDEINMLREKIRLIRTERKQAAMSGLNSTTMSKSNMSKMSHNDSSIRTPKNGMEYNREVDMQRNEIKRLKDRLTELEAAEAEQNLRAKRPGSQGRKLTPLEGEKE